MSSLTIRNRSSKISPGGIVTLPLGARKALNMQPRTGTRVTVAVQGEAVELRSTSERAGTRVSPRGQMELIGAAREILQSGAARHFWLEVHDKEQRVILHPYKGD